MTYTVSSGTLNSTIPYHTLPNVDRFSKFTSRLGSKRAMKWSLKIPTHLKCVATLPCEMCPETSNNLKVLSCSSKENFNVLTDLCHCEYSECPPVAQMQTWRRLHRWSVALSVPLCSTSAHTSVRHCIKSFTSCTFVSWTRRWIMPQI